MAILTISVGGQVTLPVEVLSHLGVKPGDNMELDLVPAARVMLKAVRPNGTIGGFVALLAGRSQKVATLDAIDEASAEAWAGNKK